MSGAGTSKEVDSAGEDRAGSGTPPPKEDEEFGILTEPSTKPSGIVPDPLPKPTPPTPPKSQRPHETQHIDYTDPGAADGVSPSKVPALGPSKSGQSTGTGNKGTSGQHSTLDTLGYGDGAYPGRDPLLSVSEATSMVTSWGERAGIIKCGQLYKLIGKTPLDINWKKYWFYLVGDRLYYSTDFNREKPIEDNKTRYICLDRIPVRPLPHRRKHANPYNLTLPDIGVAMVNKRVLAHLGVKLKEDTCFGLVSGSHTYFLAAETREIAMAWVKALRQTWMHCFKHTLRGTDPDGAVHGMSRLMAQNELLRQSLLAHTSLGTHNSDSEYWRNWLEEKARNRVLEEQLHNNAIYEIEVKTGRIKGASTDARVYMELYGPYDEVTTGEIRLVNADSHKRAFTRGALDMFIVTARDVGLPKTIKVWHDNTGRHPDWFLEFVQIRKRVGRAPPGPAPLAVVSPRKAVSAFTTPTGSPAPKAKSKPGTPMMKVLQGQVQGTQVNPLGGTWGPWVTFPCQRWFSTQIDDFRISRLLFAGHNNPLVQYKVVTVTSDLRGAGTDANVHLIMHGMLGDGKRHILTSGPDDFDRGIKNEFVVDDEELSELYYITIGHDNTGYSPSWHLDHVIITNTKTGKAFVFPCRSWFDTRMGDGLIERELSVAEDAGKLVPYVFQVTTSDIRGAGTDADVHVALHGDLGSTPTTVLPSRPEHFERGHTDTFRLVLPHVGTVRSLTIGHNNMGPGPEWHLDMAEVLDEEANKTYYFGCGKWFGQGIEEGLLERTLAASDKDPRGAFTEYKVDFYTSSMRGAGTDAVVYFQLYGDVGDSEVQRVVAPKEAFERGCVDSFTYKMRYLGKLRRMLVQHDNTGANPAWHLFKVVVTCTKDNAVTVFVCNEWIRSEDPSILPSVELLADKPVPVMVVYRLMVVTSDMRGAGTDSNIFVEVHGTQGKLGPTQLDNPAAFDRAAKDMFTVEGTDLGQLTKLVVSADGRGTRPLWNLDHIMVYRGADNTEEGVYFPCRAWFDKERGMTKELFPMRRELDLPKVQYVVRVFTSDMKGAGTDASIDMGLIGPRGETGWHRLVANYDTFERAQEDVFPLTMLDVGVPAFMLLRTDAHSAKPTWHFDFAVVEAPDGRHPPVFFVGQCWLGPAPQYPLEVKLPAVREDPRADRAQYRLWVHTSDVRFAGTDAGIVMEILGDRGTSGRHPMTGDGTKDLFERAQVDEFIISCRNLGGLRALRIESDGKSTKPSWHLDYVVIQAPSGEKYYFPFANWMGPPPNIPMVEIPASLMDPTQGRREYKVVTHTSDMRSAGTDANVYVDIQGAAHSTGKTWLKNAKPDCFERGQSDEFEVRAAGDLGPLIQLVIGHDNSGQGPSWHLEQVDVTDVKTGQTWYFDCNQWFDTNMGDRLIERTLVPSLQNPRTARTTYFIVVKTSTLPNSGTDAKVYVELRGDGGSSGKQWLRNASPNPFENGQADEFTLELRSLGSLQELVIGHDNSGLNPNWHLELVSVTDLATKITYWFECNKWFDISQGDGKIERVLRASLTPPVPPNKPELERTAPYQITVVTSDVSGAGTDANVWCILYGESGKDTGKLKLDNKGNDFERGQRDVFNVTAKEVDPLRKLRVGHDNSGVGAAWHLASIEVVNKNTGARYVFNCNRWLSTKHDDFQIERDLYPVGSQVEENLYTFEVHTSDIKGAGTDANITCILYGEKGETGALKLDNPKNNFEQGAVDKFIIRSEDVGPLLRMKIWSDDKGMGSAWHLEYVTVVSSANPSTMYWFYCGQWFDKLHGLEKSLAAWLTDPRNHLTTYSVTTHTSDISGAGTDANVFINMFGSKGESSACSLDRAGRNDFERGQADNFKLKMIDLGELTELEVWHDNSGLGPGWHLDYIEVHSSATNRIYYFVCGLWLDTKEGDGKIRRRLVATTKDPRTFKARYRVSVTTSDIRGAGTDANVFIIIYGNEGDTGKVTLDNAMKNDFEQGQTDVFEFDSRNVGKPMTKIRIGHDGTGFGAGWHLAKVVVENLATGESVTFECNRWLDRKEDDGAIERDLFPSASIVGATHWKLTVVTGDESGAGTDANVFCMLRGDKAAFGPHQLTAQKAAFETGGRDEFSLTTPDLGAIQDLTMSHDNKGFGAAWYLDSCELEKIETGEKWFFDFKCWLDSKHGLQVTRPPSRFRKATRAGNCNYRVVFETGPSEESRLEKGAVSVDIRGSLGATGRQSLDLPPQGFLPLRREEYALSSLPDTGGITQLELGHTGVEVWAVNTITVINDTTGAHAQFAPDKPVHPGEFVILNAVRVVCDYEVEVATTNRFNAGTSAAPWVNLYGVQGATGRVDLEHGTQLKSAVEGGGSKAPEATPTKTGTLPSFCSPSKGPANAAAGDAPGGVCITRPAAFSRGGRGTFVLHGLPDVGPMQQLEVGHDNTGCSPGWHLAWVRVTNLTTGASAYFVCNQWLAKNEGDKKTSRLLDAETSTEPPPTSADALLQTSDGGMDTRKDQATPPSPPPQVYVPSTLMRKLGMGVMGQPGYKISFITSNIVMAGTNAPVFFEVIGEYGSSGTVLAKATMGQFSRGSRDEFIYPNMPFLGGILQLRVGTTGQGMFATWHLRGAEVVHISSGARWVFKCHDWIDKKCGWQRVLAAQPAQ